MKFLCFTTCDCRGDRQAEYARLVRQLKLNIDASVEINHVVLFQRATQDNIEQFRVDRDSVDRHELMIDNLVSLAAARNIMIRYALTSGIWQAADVVCFPDDDAWYEAGFLSVVSSMFGSNSQISLVTSDYGSLPERASAGAFQASNDIGHFVRYLSSNTIFVRKHAADGAGRFFDERLGLGAPLNGGEDLDYALRCLAASGGSVGFSTQKLVGHRDRQPWVKVKYFRGSLAALCRHASYSLSGKVQAIRKTAIGATWLLTGKMSFSDYIESLSVGMTFFRHHDDVSVVDTATAVSRFR